MKKQLLAVALFLACTQVSAQTEKLGQPVSWKSKVTLSTKSVKMPGVDNAALQTAEMNRRATTMEKNLRFGLEQEVSINFMEEGESQVLPNGDVLRQLTIKSTGALSLNLIFSQFELAKGSRLYLFNDDKTEFIGAHTSLNNNVNKVMGTELIHDDVIIVELTEPAAVAGTSTLVIGTVIHGFLDLEQELKALNSSGNCEYDVNCPIGIGWENQRNSVAMMVQGGGFCTGSLINNTSGTIIPYFLSANHCGTTAASWVFRFRWESPAAQADCATPGNSVNGPETMNVNGGVLLAHGANSDFALSQLNSAPDPAWGIYYNGWDRTENFSPGGTGIHHPAGDIKKISFENTTLISTTFSGCPPNSHWGVTSWDQGVTEGGSSGSPLFNAEHKTIGQLHGGASSCTSSQLSDEYGKLAVSWAGGGTNDTRLSNWLDPTNSGVTSINGVNPAGDVAIDAGLMNLAGVSGGFCSTSVTPQVNITNFGTSLLTSATITYGYDGLLNQTYTWTGSLDQYQYQLITLPAATLAGGSHTFQATVSNPNAGVDGNGINNTASSTFTTIQDPVVAQLSLTLDCWGSETSWELSNTAGGAVLFEGGGYQDDGQGGEVITASFCLATGCYAFKLMDEEGDGLTGGSCDSGFYSIIVNGNQVAGLSRANADFGTQNIQTFCVQQGPLSLEEIGEALWSIYPNPADKAVTVQMAQIEGQKSIVVKNTLGQTVKLIETQNSQELIEVTGLSKGVYFISVTAASGTTTKPFVVK